MQSNVAMCPTEALATLQSLHETASISAFNAALNYDLRQMLLPDLLEQCGQALVALEQVVLPENEMIDSK